MLKLSLDPRHLSWLLVTVAGILVVLNLISIGLSVEFALNAKSWPLRLFRLDKEMNVPTLFSTLLLLVSSALLMLLWYGTRIRGTHTSAFWLLLAAIFAFLAVDEFVKVHELLIDPVRAGLGTSGALRFAWVIPYGVGVFVLGLACLRFLFGLLPEVRWRIIAGGCLYVSGALAMEMAGSYYVDMRGYPYGSLEVDYDLTYGIITTIEEFLEMVGIIVFIEALLLACKNYLQEINVTIKRTQSVSSARA